MTTFDLFDPTLQQDPHPHYEAMRADQAVHYVEANDLYLVLSNELVLDVLRSATQPLATREITERLLAGRRAGAAHTEVREALHKTVLAALNNGRNKGIIGRTGGGRGVAASWRIVR